MNKIFSLFFLLIPFALSAQCPGPDKRTALNTLQKSQVVEGTKAYQVPVTDACGNMVYAQYVEINPGFIAYTPSPTGNTQNLSEFVKTGSGDIWYIDGQGRGIKLFDAAGGKRMIFKEGLTSRVDTAYLGSQFYNDTLKNNITTYRTLTTHKQGLGWGAIVFNDNNEGGPVRIVCAPDSLSLRDAINGAGTLYGEFTVTGTSTRSLSVDAPAVGDVAAAPGYFQVIETYGLGDQSRIVARGDTVNLGAENTTRKNWLQIGPDSSKTVKIISYTQDLSPFFTANTLVTKQWVEDNTVGALLYEGTWPEGDVPPVTGDANGPIYGYNNTDGSYWWWDLQTSTWLSSPPWPGVTTSGPLSGSGFPINPLTVLPNSIDDTYIPNLAISLSKLKVSGATTGQVPKWNGTAWAPANDNAGGTAIKMDNWRLPGIVQYIPAQGLGANESVANYGFASVNILRYKFNTVAHGTSSTEFGGWLANGSSGDSISVRAPYSVVIGDSQAEGHPATHGRLHPGGVATFTATTPDVYGQLSFKWRALTKMRWFNHGIGGQTSTQVWARWSRDVLSQTFDPGDGRGSRTLAAGTKPVHVVVIVGINDAIAGTITQTTINNLENMARSARDNGIACTFFNLPGDTVITQAALLKIDTLNAYFRSGALQGYGAAVYDYNTWWKGSSVNSWNDNAHKGQWITDDIHPSQAGYDTLATSVFNAIKFPVLDSIIVYNEIGPGSFTGFSRPTGITLDQRAYTIPNTAIGRFKVNYGLSFDSVFIKIVSSTNVSGTTYSGFSHIVFKVANDTAGLATRRQLYEGYVGPQIWTKSGNTIAPTSVSDKLVIGVTAPFTSTTQFSLKSPLSNGNEVFNIKNAANTTLIGALDNGRAWFGGTSPLAATPLSVNGNVQFGTTTNYLFSAGGGDLTLFAPTVQQRYMSTAVNTGGTGRTQVDAVWNAVDFIIQPSTTGGINNPFTWKNLAGTNIFRISTSNQGISTTALSLGTTPNNDAGVVVQNTTSAALGAQQISPMLRLSGQGWATTGASRTVDFRLYTVPVQGTSAPTGYLSIGSGVNNAFTNDQFAFTSAGNFGVNTISPTSAVDLNGVNGYTQLRLRTTYTPTSSADANGQTGDTAWDDNFFYIKTSAGWKRAALNSF